MDTNAALEQMDQEVKDTLMDIMGDWNKSFSLMASLKAAHSFLSQSREATDPMKRLALLGTAAAHLVTAEERRDAQDAYYGNGNSPYSSDAQGGF